eukprot:5804484-Amphidinium_carterae.1
MEATQRDLAKSVSTCQILKSKAMKSLEDRERGGANKTGEKHWGGLDGLILRSPQDKEEENEDGSESPLARTLRQFEGTFKQAVKLEVERDQKVEKADCTLDLWPSIPFMFSLRAFI